MKEILPPDCPERTWSKKMRKDMKKIREEALDFLYKNKRKKKSKC